MAWLMSSLSLVLPWLMAMAYSSPVLICLMVWQVLNCSAVSWLATSVGDYGVALIGLQGAEALGGVLVGDNLGLGEGSPGQRTSAVEPDWTMM